MKTNALSLLFCTFISFVGIAQDYPGFIPSYQRFSGETVDYFLKKDSSKVEGKIKDLDRKKGLIEKIEVISNNKTIVLKPEELLNAYLEPSTTSKINQITNHALRVDKRGTYSINNDLLNKGYAFFESHLTQVKKDEVYVLLQLVNPESVGRIRVFDDPFGTQAMSVGMYGMTMAGGNEKSFYIKKDNAKVFKLKKAELEDEFEKLFGDCPKVKAYANNRIKWSDLNVYVYIYNTECAK